MAAVHRYIPPFFRPTTSKLSCATKPGTRADLARSRGGPEWPGKGEKGGRRQHAPDEREVRDDLAGDLPGRARPRQGHPHGGLGTTPRVTCLGKPSRVSRRLSQGGFSPTMGTSVSRGRGNRRRFGSQACEEKSGGGVGDQDSAGACRQTHHVSFTRRGQLALVASGCGKIHMDTGEKAI